MTSLKSLKKPKTPRKYLSWSAFYLAKHQPSVWMETYLYGNKRSYQATDFGSKFAKDRHGGKGSENKDIAFAMMFLPKYPKREYIMTANVGCCEILGKFDGYDPRKGIIADDKTRKHLKECLKCTPEKECSNHKRQRWTQARADKEKQFTWYCYIYWKKFKKMPVFKVHWYDYETKELKTFTTTRTLKDFLLLQAEINEVWSWILKVSQEEYQRII